jgi:cytochrome P450
MHGDVEETGLTVARGKSLDSKNTKNPLATALLSQLRWKISNQEVNLFKLWNPIRPVVAWYNSRLMNTYISKELDKRYDEYLTALSTGEEPEGKSVISLVFDGYLKQSGLKNPSLSLDKKLRSYALYQIRTFLFAGHDTTSSSICHIFYLLSKNPSTLQKLRDEHDAILGISIEAAPQVISDNPHLLNQLTYTLAVIKEAMRLFPPASGIRQGIDGVDIHDDSGCSYPTSGTFVWILHQAMQRDPKYWPNPNNFIPERWLVGPEDPMYPVKGTWRPFEHGPRNCIGQGLVLMELKIVLALTVREFDVRDAYEEFDAPRGQKGTQIKDVEGERAYQIEQGGAHPADRFPCRVSLRT